MMCLMAASSRLGKEAQFIDPWSPFPWKSCHEWDTYDLFADQIIFHMMLPKNWEVLR